VSEQGVRLLRTADAQILELIELFSGRDDGVLTEPCPARAKLADGTIGAVAWHTAENYRRIARFVSDQPDGGHPNARSASDITLSALGRLLVSGRDALQSLGDLSEERLNAVPPAGAMRFCDGRRTLQGVLAGLLTHQANNVQALKIAVESSAAQSPSSCRA
jgi:hypothetical protein